MEKRKDGELSLGLPEVASAGCSQSALSLLLYLIRQAGDYKVQRVFFAGRAGCPLLISVYLNRSSITNRAGVSITKT